VCVTPTIDKNNKAFLFPFRFSHVCHVLGSAGSLRCGPGPEPRCAPAPEQVLLRSDGTCLSLLSHRAAFVENFTEIGSSDFQIFTGRLYVDFDTMQSRYDFTSFGGLGSQYVDYKSNVTYTVRAGRNS
jgi:hypothetical protein